MHPRTQSALSTTIAGVNREGNQGYKENGQNLYERSRYLTLGLWTENRYLPISMTMKGNRLM